MMHSIGALDILLLVLPALLFGDPAVSHPQHPTTIANTIVRNLRSPMSPIQNEPQDAELHRFQQPNRRDLADTATESVGWLEIFPVCFEIKTSSKSTSTFETRPTMGIIWWLYHSIISGWFNVVRVYTPRRTCEELCPCEASGNGRICAAIHTQASSYTCTCRDGFVMSQNDACIPMCGGFAGMMCPDDLVCVDDPSDECDAANGGADCIGICVEGPPFCSGLAGLNCTDGLVCVDYPGDECDPNNGGADCIGVCVQEKEACAGLAGLDCPTGLVCIDDPNDDCDPEAKGSECSGICIQQSCNSQFGIHCPENFQCESVTVECLACDGICVRIPK